MQQDFDVVVVGAGVVGLACAATLARSGLGVLVLDRHERGGQETSSRNSGVIHAGIYYPEESLKARLCVRGRELLYLRCAAHGIPHRKIGKLIVASDEAQVPALLQLRDQARGNGVQLQVLSPGELAEQEPHLRGVLALWSPETGIIDAHELVRDYQRVATEAGALFSFRTEVLGLQLRLEPGGPHGSAKTLWTVETSDPRGRPPGGTAEDVTCVTSRWVVNAAGLAADRIAALAGIDVDRAGLRLHPCKGSYFTLPRHLSAGLSHLVYPLPSATGLGIHLTFDLGGALLAGPDSEYVNTLDVSVDPSRARSFAQAISRYFPGVEPSDLSPAYAGIRPKLQAPGGPPRDFVIEHAEARGCPGLVNLIGIESPGLTASPAIAELVASLMGISDEGQTGGPDGRARREDLMRG